MLTVSKYNLSYRGVTYIPSSSSSGMYILCMYVRAYVCIHICIRVCALYSYKLSYTYKYIYTHAESRTRVVDKLHGLLSGIKVSISIVSFRTWDK